MKKMLLAAAAGALLAAGALDAAQAAPPSRHDDHGRYDSHDQYERRAERRYSAGRYAPPRGYKPRHWRRGDRLPPEYHSRAYVIDYKRYHLAPPPRGYHYVRVGDDVVLAAIASGVISSVILQMFQ